MRPEFLVPSTSSQPLLALETSGLLGSIALMADGTITERQLATEGRRHAQTLTLEIRDLLASRNVSPRDLQGVAVSLGPGSFTGLRVGLVCAKTLAYALGCQIIGVETFAAIVDGIDQTSLSTIHFERYFVVSDAQRGDFYLAGFTRDPDGVWIRSGEFQIVPGSEWAGGLTSCDLVLGPGVSRLSNEDTPATLCREPWSLQPSASAICRRAQQQAAAGSVDDPWTLAPIYLRPSAAEEQRARRDAADNRGLPARSASKDE